MLNEKKQELLEKIKSWILIFVGCTAMCAGFVFFINPYNIIPGGVYGASIVLHNIFPSVQVGTFGYCFEIPLMLLSLLLLGAKLGIRTIVACLVQPLIMNVLSWMAYPDQASLEALDPTRIAGDIGGSRNDWLAEHLAQSLCKHLARHPYAYAGVVAKKFLRKVQGIVVYYRDGFLAQLVELVSHLGNSLHIILHIFHFADKHKHSLVAGALLDFVHFVHGLCVGGIASNAPDGVGRVKYYAAFAHDLDGCL